MLRFSSSFDVASSPAAAGLCLWPGTLLRRNDGAHLCMPHWFPTRGGRYSAEAMLRCRSCLIDGEVVVCREDGLAMFDLLRYRPQRNEAQCSTPSTYWTRR
jgi:hypothetical protein